MKKEVFYIFRYRGIKPPKEKHELIGVRYCHEYIVQREVSQLAGLNHTGDRFYYSRACNL